MRRGEVWWVSFPVSSSGAARKPVPAVIVSNGAANQHANRVQVVPLSSKTSKLYPCEARVAIAGMESKAMANQIMTVSKKQLTERFGVLSHEHMRGGRDGHPDSTGTRPLTLGHAPLRFDRQDQEGRAVHWQRVKADHPTGSAQAQG
jgi:mRNA interferase MazF